MHERSGSTNLSCAVISPCSIFLLTVRGCTPRSSAASRIVYSILRFLVVDLFTASVLFSGFNSSILIRSRLGG